MRRKKSERARHDIRLSGHPQRKDHLICDDDYIAVRSPLTWAAAVHHGWDQWAWANRQHFEDFLSTEDAPDYLNEWKKRMEKGKVYVYIAFNVPVPVWVLRNQNGFNHYGLTNLALEFDAWSLPYLEKSTPNNWLVWDEENRYTKSIDDVKQMIRSEPTRQDPPQDEEIPITRGANVIKTLEEAENVVAHLDMAIQAITQWGKSFDPRTIEKDVIKPASRLRRTP